MLVARNVTPVLMLDDDFADEDLGFHAITIDGDDGLHQISIDSQGQVLIH